MEYRNKAGETRPDTRSKVSAGSYEGGLSDRYAQVVAAGTGLSAETVKQQWAAGRDPVAEDDWRFLAEAKRNGIIPSYIDKTLKRVIGPDWADRDPA